MRDTANWQAENKRGPKRKQLDRGKSSETCVRYIEEDLSRTRTFQGSFSSSSPIHRNQTASYRLSVTKMKQKSFKKKHKHPLPVCRHQYELMGFVDKKEKCCRKALNCFLLACASVTTPMTADFRVDGVWSSSDELHLLQSGNNAISFLKCLSMLCQVLRQESIAEWRLWDLSCLFVEPRLSHFLVVFYI